MNIQVDRERLAWELEEGMVKGDFGWIYPREYRLRAPVCGLVSAAIVAHLSERQVAGRVVESPYDPEGKFNHILPIVGEGDDAHVIDACPTQFLEAVGLVWGYADRYGEASYPADKIFDYRLSDTDSIVDWLTAEAVKFRDRSPADTFVTMFGNTIGIGPMSGASDDELRSYFAGIYDSSIFEDYPVPERVGNAAQFLSGFISEPSIQVS